MNIFSDIVCDIKKSYVQEFGKLVGSGDSLFTKGKFGLIQEDFTISSKTISELFGKPKGKYTLLSVKDLLDANKEELVYYTHYLTKQLKEYLGKISNEDNILIVGLGNKYISADSLGAEVVKNVIVTRGLVSNMPSVSAITPGVLGLTGIESSDIVNGIISKVKPNKIIVIDSLCASEISRLGKSIQITNSGIVPGGGIGNARKKISSATTKCETIVIGVPLVIYARTFVYSALTSEGLGEKELEKFRGTNDNIFVKQLVGKIDNVSNLNFKNALVTIKDIEGVVKVLCKVISTAINRAVIGVDNLDE